ncbi:MAG: dipeptide ABC transporter ATP-binding protein [Granulosicoccus sp.]
MTDARKRILDITDLHVRFNTTDAQVHAVKGVNVQLHQGECLGIVGESGSGKSQSFLAAMGLLAANGYASGRVVLNGTNLLALDPRALNQIRGNRISMIFQDPLTSLTPHLQIGEQMAEVLRIHRSVDRKRASAKCLEWLKRVRIPDAEQRLQQYPHELSGGMRQRIMIAMAMLCKPDVLIADEPTTALDVTIQAEILDLMNELRTEHGTAIALITHDMGVVARMCDRVQVMRYGEYVEEGTSEVVFYKPRHDYTRMLLNAVPRIPTFDEARNTIADSADDVMDDEWKIVKRDNDGIGELSDNAALLLDIDDVHVEFPVAGKWFARARKLPAVDGISFQLHEGETLGIVGESGSGKSTLARAILQLLPYCAGAVSWLGTSLSSLDKEAMTSLRSDLQIVFQDPLASLNPSLTIGDSIMEPLRVHQPDLSLAGRAQAVAVIMHKVGLDPNLINRYPHELSGGQNQRVGIARAMILRPKLMICDEAVSALDVSIQAQIIDLIKSLQREFSLSLIFISHDLSVVYEVAHRILVMYLGRPMELAPARSLFSRPQHPYTRQLVSAVPVPDPVLERKRHRIRLLGELTSPMDPVARLRFLPSRLNAGDLQYRPSLDERFEGHFVAEHDALESLLQIR